MWFDNHHIWMHYPAGILAADKESAHFLQRYIHLTAIYRNHLSVMEVIDLQKYKVIKDFRKVKQAVNERLGIPFVFLSCKN